MTGQQPGGESRYVSAAEILKMARFFGVAPPQLLKGENIEEPGLVPLAGRIGKGGKITNATGDLGIRIGPNSLITGDWLGYQIEGDALQPKHGTDELLLVERDGWSIEQCEGMESVIRTIDGLQLVRRVERSGKPGVWRLVGLHEATEARVEWCSPVRFMVPNIGLVQVPD